MVNSRYTGKKDNQESFKVVLFCGSSGAMDVLENFLLEINQGLKAAIVVLLHRKAATKDYLVRYLDKKIRLKVLAIEHGMLLEKGNIYMVPAGYHCIMEKNMTLSLDLSEKVMFSRPSADVSLESFSYNLEERLIAIIVSGANADGANGARWVWKRNGKIIVQNPEEAAIGTMPAAVIEAIDMVDHVVPSNQLYNTAAKYF